MGLERAPGNRRLKCDDRRVRSGRCPLRNAVNRLMVIGDDQRGPLRVAQTPEDDGVDIDRNRVDGQRLLGIESCGLKAHVNHRRHAVKDGADGE